MRFIVYYIGCPFIHVTRFLYSILELAKKQITNKKEHYKSNYAYCGKIEIMDYLKVDFIAGLLEILLAVLSLIALFKKNEGVRD